MLACVCACVCVCMHALVCVCVKHNEFKCNICYDSIWSVYLIPLLKSNSWILVEAGAGWGVERGWRPAAVQSRRIMIHSQWFKPCGVSNGSMASAAFNAFTEFLAPWRSTLYRTVSPLQNTLLDWVTQCHLLKDGFVLRKFSYVSFNESTVNFISHRAPPVFPWRAIPIVTVTFSPFSSLCGLPLPFDFLVANWHS